MNRVRRDLPSAFSIVWGEKRVRLGVDQVFAQPPRWLEGGRRCLLFGLLGWFYIDTLAGFFFFLERVLHMWRYDVM